jgi:hypothetical protein
MSKLKPLIKYISIAIFIIIFIIFRRFFLDNERIIMGTLYTLGGIVLFLGVILIVLHGKLNKYIQSDEFDKAIEFSKKLKFYPNLSQSFILNILVNALNKNKYDFVYTNVKELNWVKGIQWRYFVEVIYYSLTDDIFRVESTLQLLRKCKIENDKLKYLDDIIKISSYVLDEQEMTEDFYLENVKSSLIVGENVLMNDLLRKCLKPI